jgi:hypothetical protein
MNMQSTGEDPMDTPKPIGYWLMHLHNLLEEHFEQTLADLAVDRRQWQLLNTLSRGSRTSREVREALAPFWTGEAEDPAAAIAGLAARGWTRTEGDLISLTVAGRAQHAELAARVGQTRAVVLGDLSAEEYRRTVATLQTMAANVEAAIHARATSPMS